MCEGKLERVCVKEGDSERNRGEGWEKEGGERKEEERDGAKERGRENESLRENE